ncbi:ABC transporter ATP-binding protein [Castellaniella sp. S9]|uniref:ABC transporter ATP-binding protein n=1 Tax=Castellaniella sp. S9 TaxID=2993652 RepID=UPI0022B5660F|nr:ATP-binding cassette domain-containing protein [Castellaniella sp. S9]
MSPILQVSNLNRTFGAVIAASDINLSIFDQETVAIIGSNGAGKTTFVNMVSGYLKPSSGIIQFKEQDITGLPPRGVCKAGLCRSFQVAQLFPALTVLENMMIAFAMLHVGYSSFFNALDNRTSRSQSLEVLKNFGIADHADAKVGALAQGVRKLLDISMAMVSRPALLLLDEPTSGVAIDEKFALMEAVMTGVRESGAAVMFIEHDMEIVSRYANRTIAFYEGTVIADGATPAVLSDERVRKFIVGEIQEAAIAATGHD